MKRTRNTIVLPNGRVIKARRPSVLLHPAVRKIHYRRAGFLIGSIWRKGWKPRWRGNILDPRSEVIIFYFDGRVVNGRHSRIDSSFHSAVKSGELPSGTSLLQ